MSRSAVVIVGGGPAGLAAARAYRHAGGAGPVAILAGERHAPYERPPLTKDLLRGESEPGELAIEASGWFRDHAVELRVGDPVEAIDVERRTVRTASGAERSWQSLVIATGAVPIRVPVPGADDPSLLTVRTVEDALELRRRALPGRRAVVVGSGFIGCEAAASLAMRGVEVTVVAGERLPQAGRLGEEVGERIADWLAEADVTLRGGVQVAAIEGGDGHEVTLDDGSRVVADIVVLATGVRPCGALAVAVDLPTVGGRLVVDETMRSAVDGVLAAGDVALARNAAAGRRLSVEHWGEALNQGCVAGLSAAGAPARWDAAPGFWSTIGRHTIKHVAWGDGWDEARLVAHGGAFTVWYGREGRAVGVLTHDRDRDYERGRALVEQGARLP